MPDFTGPAPYRWLSLALMLALLLATGRAPAQEQQSHEALSEDWKLVSDRKGIQVYMRHKDKSRLKTFRGVMRMKLADEYAMVALLNDYEAMPEWLHFVDGATEIKRDGPLLRYMRFTTNLPWPLKDREAVLRADVEQTFTTDENSVLVHLNNRPKLIPPNKKYVRFPQLTGVFGARRMPGDRVEIIYQLVLDPGGYIPAWLANIILRDTPYFTLQKMRRMLRKPEYEGQYFDYVDLKGPGRPPEAGPPPGMQPAEAQPQPEQPDAGDTQKR